MFGLSLHIFSPNSTLLCWRTLLVVRFPLVFLPSKNWARKDSLMRFTFLDNASRLPSSFPNSILYQVHSENFRCDPPKRSIPILQLWRLWSSGSSPGPWLGFEAHPGPPPFHPSSLLTEVSTLLTGPSASRNTLTVSTITDGYARTINPDVGLTVHRAAFPLDRQRSATSR